MRIKSLLAFVLLWCTVGSSFGRIRSSFGRSSFSSGRSSFSSGRSGSSSGRTGSSSGRTGSSSGRTGSSSGRTGSSSGRTGSSSGRTGSSSGRTGSSSGGRTGILSGHLSSGHTGFAGHTGHIYLGSGHIAGGLYGHFGALARQPTLLTSLSGVIYAHVHHPAGSIFTPWTSSRIYDSFGKYWSLSKHHDDNVGSSTTSAPAEHLNGNKTTDTDVVSPDAFTLFTIYPFREGNDVNINCYDSFPPNVTVNWTRDSGDELFYQSGIQLQMTTISRNNSGNYTCIWNGGPFHNARVLTVYIDVQYPVKVSHFSIEPESPLEYEVLTVHCGMDGNPKPEPDLIENNYIVFQNFSLSENASFELNTLSCGVLQVIECRGKNLVATNKTDGTEQIRAQKWKAIRSSCPPRLHGWEPTEQVIMASLGGQTSLRTHFIGYPSLVYSWSRDDGQPIREPGSFIETTAYLYNLDASDFGNYTLTASNSLGNATAHFYLIQDAYTGSGSTTFAGHINILATLLCTTISTMLIRHLL